MPLLFLNKILSAGDSAPSGKFVKVQLGPNTSALRFLSTSADQRRVVEFDFRFPRFIALFKVNFKSNVVLVVVIGR